MSKIERFEDLIAWQKARALTQVIYEISGLRASVEKQRDEQWHRDK